MAENVDPNDLVSASDIADLLAVTPAAVSNWQARLPEFPQPIVAVARGNTPLWSRTQIVAWYRTRLSESVIDARLALYKELKEMAADG